MGGLNRFSLGATLVNPHVDTRARTGAQPPGAKTSELGISRLRLRVPSWITSSFYFIKQAAVREGGGDRTGCGKLSEGLKTLAGQ